MRWIITLLALIPLAAWSDARIELGDQNADGHNCHAPWDQDDADNEYKNFCEAMSLQHADGTYTAQATMTYLNRVPELVDAPISLGPGKGNGFAKTVTNCEVTAGTFQNDDGTAFTTNDCEVVITYSNSHPSGKTGLVDIHIDMVLYRAAQAGGAALAASEMAGMSKSERNPPIEEEMALEEAVE